MIWRLIGTSAHSREIAPDLVIVLSAISCNGGDQRPYDFDLQMLAKDADGWLRLLRPERINLDGDPAVSKRDQYTPRISSRGLDWSFA